MIRVPHTPVIIGPAGPGSRTWATGAYRYTAPPLLVAGAMLYSPQVVSGAIPPLNYPVHLGEHVRRWGHVAHVGLFVAACVVMAAKEALLAALPGSVGDAFAACAQHGEVVGSEAGTTCAPWALHTARIVDLMVMTLTGYAFVSRVVLRRRAAFGSRYGSAGEAVKVTTSMAVVYWLAPRYTMDACRALRAGAADSSRMMPALGCAGSAPILELVVPLAVALHFVFLDSWPFLQLFGLKWPVPSRWSTFTVPEALFAAGILAALALFVGHHVSLMIDTPDAAAAVAALYGAVGLGFGATAFALRRHWNVHFHHYLLGLTMLPLTRFDTTISCVAQGLFLGVFIEGCAVWGMDPVLVRSRGAHSTGDGADGVARDYATELWTTMILAVGDSSARRWLRVLQRLRGAFARTEAFVAEAARRSASAGVGGVGTLPWSLLARSAAVDADVAELEALVARVDPRGGSAVDATGGATSGSPRDDLEALGPSVSGEAESPGLRAGGEASDDDALAAVALADTLYLALVSGGGDLARAAQASHGLNAAVFQFRAPIRDTNTAGQDASAGRRRLEAAVRQAVTAIEDGLSESDLAKLRRYKEASCDAVLAALEP